MSRISESAIEKFTIKLLEKHGYQHDYTPERNRFENVLLLERLQSAVGRITQNKAKTSDTKNDQGMNSNQIRTLKELRDTLLPKLMSGEVRVKFEQQGVGT